MVVDGDCACVNQMKRNDKRSSSKKDTKSEHIHRIKEVNNNNLRPSYFPKWVSQLPLISLAADPRRFGKVKPPTEYVSVPADIDSYTVVDGNLEISQKELPRVKSRSGQKFFWNNSCHFTLKKNTSGTISTKSPESSLTHPFAKTSHKAELSKDFFLVILGQWLTN